MELKKKILNNDRTSMNDLRKMADMFNIPLRDVYSKNHLKDINPLPGGYIINLQDSDEGWGTHWVALYLDKEGRNQKSFYFDSFGVAPPIEVEHFCSPWSLKVVYSDVEIQDIQKGFCGQYCILFLHDMAMTCRSFNESGKQRYLNFINNFTDTIIYT